MRPAETQDTRRTAAEKLTALRELMNEMARVAAREKDNAAFQQLAVFATRGHQLLDGAF